MSEFSTPEERTEMPTSKRIGKLRQEGLVHKSTEVVTVVSLLAGYYVLKFSWGWIFDDMKTVFVKSFRAISSAQNLDLWSLRRGFYGLLWDIAPVVFLVVTAMAIVAVLAVMLQTNWNVKQHWIKFNFGWLNPFSGLKRIVSIQGFVQTIKSVLKLCIILPIAYYALKQFAPDMVMLTNTSVEYLLTYTGNAMGVIFWKVMYLLIFMAILDWFWTKYLWLRQNKMTKEEVKDERKAQEGDEATKKRIQTMGLQRIKQRLMLSVPQADVVITNPTHYAVALKYDRNTMRAPMVVAKGQGFIALKIREIARSHGIPVMERKPLARALFQAGEVGKEIPYELYKAVAEVIAYVFRLKNPHANLGTATT